jgi:hypothetical protein
LHACWVCRGSANPVGMDPREREALGTAKDVTATASHLRA